ncbi:hypothetical protein C8R43DRAFT_1186557 [Mycena crocata]|nr:hypothetical protein C8R43DRAFT_1186557 [Mycena crocata]
MTSPAMVTEEEEQDEEHLEHIRKLFRAHRFQVGFSVPDGTLEAFSQGVIEGTDLQPEVLHACQLMGSLLALPLPHLQATILLSLYFSIKGELLRAQEVLATANKVVVEHNLDGALLQRPNATAESLSKRTFTPTIPAADAEINFVRAKSAVTTFEAQKLGEHWYRSDLGDDGAAVWQGKYWELMEAIETHRCAINLALTRTVLCPEHKSVGLTLKMCSIIVLTGLSHHAELRRKQHDVVVEIVSISASYSEEDCEYLDPRVSARWTVIIGMMDELALGPDVCPQFTHDLPAMAAIIGARSQTLQRVVPFALSTTCDASEPLTSLSGF